MAGNSKVWRMPVAGLASVAMLATLGVSALTANAASVSFDITLNANGGSFSSAQRPAVGRVNSNLEVSEVSASEITYTYTYNNDTDQYVSIDDALNRILDKTWKQPTQSGLTFTEWYPEAGAGAAVDPDTPLTGDVTLYAHYSNDPVLVTFKDTSSTIKVAENDSVAAWQMPEDNNKTDHQVVDYWSSLSDNKKIDVAGMTGQEIASQAGLHIADNNNVILQPNYTHAMMITFDKGDGLGGLFNDLYFFDAKDNSYLGSTVWNGKYIVEVKDGDVIPVPVARFGAFGTHLSKVITTWKNKNGQKTYSTSDWNVTADEDYTFVPAGNSAGSGTDDWTISYLVQFYNNNTGNPTLISTATVGESEKVTKPADPTREGYAFAGWYTGTGAAWDFNHNVTMNDVHAGVLKLYAHWTVTSASVTFHTNSDEMDPTLTVSFGDGQKLTAPTVTRDGYMLYGWYTDKNFRHEATYFGKELKLENGTLKVAQTFSTGSNNGDRVYYVTVANDFYAKWVRADESAVKDQEAKTPESMLYVNGDSTKEFLTESKYFTKDSFNAFTSWYQNTYLPAKEAAQNDGISRGEAAELVSMLKEAQAKLVQKAGATVYRLYNKYNGDHLYTTDQREYENLSHIGWTAEGKAFNVSAKSAATKLGYGVAVYRLFNPYNGEHLMTTDATEVANLKAAGWSVDNDGEPMFYAPQGGATPVTRLFNPYETVGTHLYSTDQDEVDSNVTAGWVEDGVIFNAE